MYLEVLLFISSYSELYWLINNHLLITCCVQDSALALLKKRGGYTLLKD